jgi:myo-inositol-hexaphosphate 3-phosphohydrolase
MRANTEKRCLDVIDRRVSRALWALLVAVMVGTAAGAVPAQRGEVAPVLQPAQVLDLEVPATDAVIWWHSRYNFYSSVWAAQGEADASMHLYRLRGDGPIDAWAGLEHPGAVDVSYGFWWTGGSRSLIVAAEEESRRLHCYTMQWQRGKYSDTGHAEDHGLAGGEVLLAEESGEAAVPGEVALYRRVSDGETFAFVAGKKSRANAAVYQYHLYLDEEEGAIQALLVRTLPALNADTEIAAIEVDDVSGYVYYLERGVGIHKWQADPGHPQAQEEIALFGQEAAGEGKLGLTLYYRFGRDGYLIASQQDNGNGKLRFYVQEPVILRPERMGKPVREYTIPGAGGGIFATSESLGEDYPVGALLTLSADHRRIMIFSWEDVAAAGAEPLAQGTGTLGDYLARVYERYGHDGK